MTEEPIGSPAGDAPTEAVDPTRRVTPPGVMIAPDDGSVDGRASAESAVGGGTDADRTVIDGAAVGAGADRTVAVSGGTHRRDLRLGYAKTVAGVLIAYAALRGLCMAIVLSWGYHVGVTPVHLFDRFDMSGYVHIARLATKRR